MAFYCVFALLAMTAGTLAQEMEFRDMPLDYFESHYVSPRRHAEQKIADDLLGKKPPMRTDYWEPPAGELPASVDWRKKGIIGPVRTQHAPGEPGCGGCWAFATIGLAESSAALDTRQEVVALSEQQLLDCDVKSRGGHDCGCDGGYAEFGVEYIIKNGGLTSEDNYPFTGEKEDCDAQKEKEVVQTVTSWKPIRRRSEEALMRAVAHRPVVVEVCCGSALEQPRKNETLRAWSTYEGGIADFPCCAGRLNDEDVYDHQVLLVGYGEENGVPYWLVKNSWSAKWGERGYIRFLRGKGGLGQCGITHGPFVAFRGGDVLAAQ